MISRRKTNTRRAATGSGAAAPPEGNGVVGAALEAERPPENSGNSDSASVGGRSERWVAALLILCAVVVAFWEIMSNRSRRPFQAFEITAADFADFAPQSDGWQYERLPVHDDPVEPNILAYRVRRSEDGDPRSDERDPALRAPRSAFRNSPVLVRLVHGYNMRDCMRIKGYEVELIADTRPTASSPPPKSPMNPMQPMHPISKNLQAWRLTYSTGDRSIWVTSMLRVGDFARTGIDTRSMAFPRVGIPDNPGWFPRGMSWRSLRHPIQNFRLFLRARWNASRCDWLTFLGLRQPAWASDELLTLVVASQAGSGSVSRDAEALEDAIGVFEMIHGELREWRGKDTGASQ